MMYKAYLIDVDHTLLDFGSDERKAFFDMAAAAGLACGEEDYRRYERINAYYWDMLSRGRISKDRLRVKRFQDWLGGGPTERPERLNALFSDALSRHAQTVDGAEQLLRALSRRARLAVVTNGVGFVQRRRLTLSGLDGFFSALVISEEAGAEKPDPRIFEAALAALDVDNPKDALMIGDSPVSDIVGALSCGIDACLFDPLDRFSSVRCTYRVARLQDVLKL